MISRNHFIASLNAEQLALLMPDMIEVVLPVGRVLYDHGDTVEQVYFPVSAVVSIVAVMKDGRSTEVSTIGCEGVVGVASALAHKTCRGRAEVQTAGTALKLPASRVRRAIEVMPAIAHLLVAPIYARVAQAEQLVACNTLHTLSERLARWLLVALDRTNAPVVKQTQEYLAEVLGVQRTTVSVAAKAMRTAGLIRYGRGQIEVLDRAGLRSVACECYVAFSPQELSVAA